MHTNKAPAAVTLTTAASDATKQLTQWVFGLNFHY